MVPNILSSRGTIKKMKHRSAPSTPPPHTHTHTNTCLILNCTVSHISGILQTCYVDSLRDHFLGVGTEGSYYFPAGDIEKAHKSPFFVSSNKHKSKGKQLISRSRQVKPDSLRLWVNLGQQWSRFLLLCKMKFEYDTFDILYLLS